MDQNEAKRLVAQAALEFLPDSGVIGLGSGSTAKLFIQGVGALVRQGRKLVGVPTSLESRQLAEELGIPLLADEGPWSVEVCVDGADEVAPNLDIIKGGGGMHTREKVVNDAAKKNVIVVDESKLVPQLGTKFAVPVEVLNFGRANTQARLAAFGKVTLRLTAQGVPYRTDEGRFIYDVHAGPIANPLGLDTQLRAIPGVVETGLFLGRAHVVLVAGAAGVRRLEPSA